MRIRLFGMPTDTGVGTHTKNIFTVIQRLADDLINIEFYSKYDLEALGAALNSSQEEDINIFMFYTPGIARLYRGKKLFWYAFESTRPMLATSTLMDEFDLILSPSQWGKDCLMNYGVPTDCVVVVPEGVNPWIYHPYPLDKRKNKDSGNKTRFLMVGKYETRKGYEVAIEAFGLAYEKNDQIEMLLKPEWVAGDKAVLRPEIINLVLKHNHLPIKVTQSLMSYVQMRQLYRSADYFLFPSLCEGWGLPLIEAIACGIPAICCEFGGQSEYLAAIPRGYLSIPYTLEKIDCPAWKRDFPQVDDDVGKWASMDAPALAEILLHASCSDYSVQAKNSSDIIRNEYSWERAGEKLLKLIFEIA
jgi:glycosyltransferase involved in cell wall biosynthesis